MPNPTPPTPDELPETRAVDRLIAAKALFDAKEGQPLIPGKVEALDLGLLNETASPLSEAGHREISAENKAQGALSAVDRLRLEVVRMDSPTFKLLGALDPTAKVQKPRPH